MITVDEILHLSLFHNFEILCGSAYISNDVIGAVILEYESSRINYDGYCYGEFVLLSYFMNKSAPELVDFTLRTIIEKHVSAIAIKKLPEETISPEIIALAKENHVPILTFYDEFMEDLIVSINESLQTKAQYIIFEEKLNSLLTGYPSGEKVSQTALEINPNFQPYVLCASITNKENASNISIHSYLDSLTFRRYRNKEDYSFSFVKFGLGMILICTFQSEDIPKDTLSMHRKVMDVLINSGINPEAYHIGICDEILPLNRLNVSAKKARNTNWVAQYKKENYLHYSELGIYKYIITLVNNPILYEDISRQIQLLIQYDEAHASNLLETLICYVENNQDYTTTSTQLYQHTNTIRYRIKKATQLLSLPEDTAEEELVVLIRSFLMHQAINLNK